MQINEESLGNERKRLSRYCHKDLMRFGDRGVLGARFEVAFCFKRLIE